MKRVETSESDQLPAPSMAGAGLDRLSSVFERFHVRASLFHTGTICGLQRFEAEPGRAFLHVLRRGEMELRHRDEGGLKRLQLTEPTLLLFPKASYHEFVNPPRDGPDFTCATLAFDGGDRNPIVQSLPSLVAVPLAAIDGLEPALGLLFSEADQNRCGSRLLANRLFEVVLLQVLRWIIDHPAQAGVTRGLIRGLSDPRLAPMFVAVHSAPEQDWTLEKMAALAAMSRSTFAAAFRSATGTTPALYVLDWRLSIAMNLMRAGQSIKQVAMELGFADPPSFSKAFHRRIGSAPRQWINDAAPS